VDFSNITLNRFMVRSYGIFYCQQCQNFRFYYLTAMSFLACSSLDSLRKGLTAFSHKNSFAELYNCILQHDKIASMDLIPTGLIQASSRMQHTEIHISQPLFGMTKIYLINRHDLLLFLFFEKQTMLTSAQSLLSAS
jgi:hypothetical protein